MAGVKTYHSSEFIGLPFIFSVVAVLEIMQTFWHCGARWTSTAALSANVFAINIVQALWNRRLQWNAKFSSSLKGSSRDESLICTNGYQAIFVTAFSRRCGRCATGRTSTSQLTTMEVSLKMQCHWQFVSVVVYHEVINRPHVGSTVLCRK